MIKGFQDNMDFAFKMLPNGATTDALINSSPRSAIVLIFEIKNHVFINRQSIESYATRPGEPTKYRRNNNLSIWVWAIWFQLRHEEGA